MRSYAQGRYIAHYLRSHRLLQPYLRLLRSQRGSDPTGYQSLLRIVELDATDAQASWERFVSSL